MIPYAQIARLSQIKEISDDNSKENIEKTKKEQKKEVEKCKELCDFSHIYRRGMSNIYDCYSKCKKNN